MNNYEFCAQWIISQEHGKNVRVLDYGCGAGKIVKELKTLGINAFGCDVFFEGGDYSLVMDPTLFEDSIRRMSGNTIPFDSASFDFVINNQVMEHVENLDSVLSEIQRVLKPGGMVLSLFPDKGVFREGHCGIPFIQRFSKGSRLRVYYTATFRLFGFGYLKENKSVMQWSQDFCEWLDKWTYYRTKKEIDSTYKKYFCDIRHIEYFWLQQRLGNRKIVATWLPAEIQKFVVNKLCGLIFVASSPYTC
jgi:SAM-dependent methyltransferase